MISRVFLSNVATYDRVGSSLEPLVKINFIYGANGSGKTTISNYLSNPSEPLYADCQIEWQNGIPLETLVYNKKFRDLNFGNDSIDGIFTLGQATKEDIERIEKKKKELEEISQSGIKTKETLEKQQEKLEEKSNEFIDWSWRIYKKYEDDFKEAFRGSIAKKKAFGERLLKEYSKNNADLLVLDELKKKSETIFSKSQKELQLIPDLEFEEIIRIEQNEIWQKKIIGKDDVDIARLIQKLNINDWVNQGRRYIQEDSNTCPFCQQDTITEEFRRKLDDYFDQSFTESINQLKSMSERYKWLFDNLIATLEQIINPQKQEPISKLDLDRFVSYVETLKGYYQANTEKIKTKLKEPSRSIELQSTLEQLHSTQELINQANEEIKKHNSLVSNLASEKKDLIDQIWKFIIEENKETIENYLKKANGFKKGIRALEKQLEEKRTKWSALNSEIQELNKNVTSVQPTVDEINRILRFYGFSNFQIVPSREDENKYQIEREDGTCAESTLSEGEITFITFLYFYQLVKGAKNKEEIGKDRILVIDDPISSLDSNVLFVVSTLIKNIINDIRNGSSNVKQLILLTHNVYFHKEVSFIDSRTRERKDTYYWIIKKESNVSKIYAYRMKNPIQTSYQLLWQELKEIQESETPSLSTVQNIMRRIIENYFKILGDYNDDSIIKEFSTGEEQAICRSLISWVNDGSHSIHDDLFVEMPHQTVEQYMEVFKRIFDVTRHTAHYNMMMKVEEET